MTKRRSPLARWLPLAVVVLVGVGVIVAAIVTSPAPPSASSSAPASSLGAALGSNPNLDPGTPLNRPAPDFTLTDQFGKRLSLHAYRGKVVILAFNDPQCTTLCPLTTTAMVDAKRLLGAAGSQVQLLGVSANPSATALKWVRAYSRAHGMTYQWRFGTGPLAQLKRIWSAYGIGVEIQHGLIDHTPALYVIDPQGRMRRLFMTQMNYSSVPQLGQLLAKAASELLPGHPPVRSGLSYSAVQGIAPTAHTSLPRFGGGSVPLGPGRPRLMLFFATWAAEDFPHLKQQLQGLDGYASAAAGGRLPPLTAVDEASVEPSANALPRFLGGLTHRLSYPVGVDRSGRIADGYEVQDLPWLVLVSSTGRFLWYYDVSTQGWPARPWLIHQVRAALSHPTAIKAPGNSAIPTPLADSPAPLAALHRQADRLLGSVGALTARLHALRGYPVVVNAWASWCTPCQKEFPLFASASLRYGRQVAFVGADTNDSANNAQPFLNHHHVSYPSYQATSGQLASLAAIEGLPTTIFINPAGKVVYVHTGQYESQGSLDADVQSYALH
ncbi:MAG TPA: redoxin domain-containing protein [Solirubrobacteraceae bacterium]|nr:redoxin domain-containing protein [Solirubrobacteraceae bacterium]